MLGALELQHDDGPWERPDGYRKINGLLRYSQGDSLNGFSITGMGYRGTWDSTDQIPDRAVADGSINRFGTIDRTDGGDTYRYSGSLEWQRTHGNAATRVTAYGIGYDLNLFSNFTFFLDDPVRGDQFHQADHRFVTGARLTHRRLEMWADARCSTRLVCSCGTTTSRTSGCTTRRRVRSSTPSGRMPWGRRAPRHTCRTKRHGRHGCAPWPVSAPMATGSR